MHNNCARIYSESYVGEQNEQRTHTEFLVGWKLDAWSPCDVHCMYNYIYHMRSLFHNPHELSFIVQIRRISVIEPDISPVIKKK